MKLTISISIMLITNIRLSAQLAEVVLGPLEGDSAGVIYAETDQTIEVDLWMRTAPGISIVAFHVPLSTKNEYVLSDSRQGGEYCELLHTWDDVNFLDPNPDPVHDGYTNQSLMALEFIEPDCDNGIITDGEWWWIASFRMTTAGEGPPGIPLCDAFIEGYHPDNHDIVLSECNINEIDRSEMSLDFACLWFVENSCGNYIVGDFNGSGEFNVADIVDSFSNLKTGSPEASFLCECPPNSGNVWAVAMDVNGSCSFNVADIVTGFSYLKTGSPDPVPCGICPPGEP